MGRPKKYNTPAALERAVTQYFKSICRQVEVKEPVVTDKTDRYGHQIIEYIQVLNDDGEKMYKTDYVTPPTVCGLCLYLGISRQTWDRYGEAEGFCDTVTRARARMETYLEEQLLERRKGVQGIIFNLQNNYGWAEKVESDSSVTLKVEMQKEIDEESY